MIANVQRQPIVEINVVDPGYHFKGPATVYKEGPLFEQGLAFYRNRGMVSPIEHIVLVKVERCAGYLGYPFQKESASSWRRATRMTRHTTS